MWNEIADKEKQIHIVVRKNTCEIKVLPTGDVDECTMNNLVVENTRKY